MDKKSFYAGLRVGLALGRTGRDAEASVAPHSDTTDPLAGKQGDAADGGESWNPDK